MTKQKFEALYERVVPRVGHEAFMKAVNHVHALTTELADLVQDAHSWGAENGHPEVQSYPQYSRVRELGEEFFRLAGLRGMQSALRSIQRTLADHPPNRYGYAIVEYGWSGIGGWEP